MLVRAKSVFITAAVIGLAVVVGLLGVGGTWALWSAAAPANAGVVQAADFRVEINGTLMTTSNGVAATVSVPPQGGLVPGKPMYAMVTITNATNAGAPFTVRAAFGTPAIGQASIPQLAQNLTVRLAVAPASGDCAAASYTNNRVAVDVPKATSAKVCVQTSLPAAVPLELQNQSATISIPVTATQKGN